MSRRRRSSWPPTPPPGTSASRSMSPGGDALNEETFMAADTSVLIVGGSLNGLTAAVLLSYHVVPCTVVERHPATTVQYKFRGISPRSMEVYRSVGLEAAIR